MSENPPPPAPDDPSAPPDDAADPGAIFHDQGRFAELGSLNRRAPPGRAASDYDQFIPHVTILRLHGLPTGQSRLLAQALLKHR
jgi:hypothetical protein